MRIALPLFIVVAQLQPAVAFAQEGLPYETRFAPGGVVDPDSPNGFLSISDELFTPDQSYTIRRYMGKKHGSDLHLYARDNATGSQVAKVSFDPGWDDDTYYDHMAFVNGQLFMIYETLDKKSGELKILAQGIDKTTLMPAGAKNVIGTIHFDPKSLSWPGKLYASLFTSADGEHTAFFFDGIRTKEDEQLIMVTMLDKNLEPVWAQGYHLQIESDQLRTVRVKVGNNGTVYMLANGTIRKKSDTNPLKGFQLIALDKDDMAIEKVSLPGDNRPMNADLELVQGKTPMVGGFYQAADSPDEETRGYYVSLFNEAVSAPVEAELRVFPQALETRIEVPRMLARSDGGLFMTGEGKRVKGIAVAQEYLFAAQLGSEGDQLWKTLVPRALYSSKSDEDYGSRSLVFGDKLVMLAPDNEENVANYRSRAELKSVRKGAENLLAFTFGDQGEYTAHLFAPADQFRAMLMNQSRDLSVGQGVYRMSGSKKASKKKWDYGSLFLVQP